MKRFFHSLICTDDLLRCSLGELFISYFLLIFYFTSKNLTEEFGCVVTWLPVDPDKGDRVCNFGDDFERIQAQLIS